MIVVWLWAPSKRWLQGILGPRINVIWGAALGPIETMVPRFPGQGFNGKCRVAAGPAKTLVQSFLGRG